MLRKNSIILAWFTCCTAALCGCGVRRAGPDGIASAVNNRQTQDVRPEAVSRYLAPVAIRSWDRQDQLLVLGSVGQQVLVLDRSTGQVRRIIPLPVAATGVAVSGDTAYLTTAEPAGRVLMLDLNTGAIRKELRVGHTPLSPIVSPDGQLLCVANRFDNTVALIDLTQGRIRTIPVVREPVALALTPDAGRLFVANHLPCVRPFADEENPVIAAEVSVIDTRQSRLIRNIELPNGSQGLRGITVSPDGGQVVVTHVLSHFVQLTTQIEKGAMNRNALSLLDADTLEWMGTVALDDPNEGAANPWAVTFSDEGRQLLVTHAGTHELSVIDYPTLLKRIAAPPRACGLYTEQDLALLAGIRKRITLGINGPRSLLEQDGIACVPGFFSDSLAMVNLNAGKPAVRVVALATPAPTAQTRLGEQYFNDATLCFQHWQSCATCHPDGRNDSLYWDLMNDGLGNTKDTKSLLMSALTPPLMWRGVRADVNEAIRAGIEHIEFAEPRPGEVEAIHAYLLAMKAVPGPRLNAAVLETPKTQQASCAKCHYPGVLRGALTAAARRGKALFEGKAGCATCHPHPTFTSMQQVDPGLGSGVRYDVPSLVEVWRSAPYLHSGEALTLRDTITNYNFMQTRGRTKDLSEQELNDLLEYLQSL